MNNAALRALRLLTFTAAAGEDAGECADAVLSCLRRDVEHTTAYRAVLMTRHFHDGDAAHQHHGQDM